MALMKPKKNRGAVTKAGKKPARPSMHWYQLKPVFLLVFFIAGLSGLYQLAAIVIEQPVNKVAISGELRFVDKDLVVKEVTPFLTRGFVLLELDAIRSRLEGLPWVYEVRVSRQWPGDVIINIVEQQAIAQWADKGFLNHRGELFDSGGAVIPGLPQLNGPSNTSKKVMGSYRAVGSLLRDKSLVLERLSLNQRGGWQAELKGGVIIEIGRDQLMEKMKRFIYSYEVALLDRFSEIKRIDMRYSNGLAVAWREKT